jgi:hypothetical protein
VANQLRVKIVNRTNATHDYTVQVQDFRGGTVIAPELPLRISAGAQRTTSLFLVDSFASFRDGRHRITLRISDGAGFSKDLPFVLLGPTHQNRGDDDDRDDTPSSSRTER